MNPVLILITIILKKGNEYWNKNDYLQVAKRELKFSIADYSTAAIVSRLR